MASGHLLVLVSVIPPPSTSSLRVNPGHPALVLLVTGLFNLGSSAQAQNAEQAGLLILRNNSLMTQIRLGSQEFPDRKTERSSLCVHASPGLQLRVTPLLPPSLEHTLVRGVWKRAWPCAPQPSPTMAGHSSPSQSAPIIQQTAAMFDLAFVLCGGGQADSSAAPSLNRVYLHSNYKQQTSWGFFFPANKRALF